MATIARPIGLVRTSIPFATVSSRSAAHTKSPFLRRQSYVSPRASLPYSRRTFLTSRTLLEKKYTQDHEWIELSEDGKTGTIGISTYASKALGDVVYVELPTADLEVSKGDSIGAVESVKSASDIMTPVSGKIVEANSVLEEKPGTINKGPEGEGWIARIEVGDAAEMEGLMGVEEYRKFTEE